MRPVLRYFGDKFRIAPWIVSHFPPHGIYVEPYGGAASVLLRKERARSEVYNDIHSDVVNLFHVLRDRESAAEFERRVRLTPFARDEFDEAYVTTDDPIEQGRRLLIRSFMGFGANGHSLETKTGFRRWARRSSTSPSIDWANWPDFISAMTERLRGVAIENRPALEVIKVHNYANTLIYCDPPYVHSTRGRSTVVRVKHEYVYEMSEDDHRELASVLHECVGMVIVSGYPSDLYDRELYPGWHRVTKTALADCARKRTEVLWLNDAAAVGQKTLFGSEMDN